MEILPREEGGDIEYVLTVANMQKKYLYLKPSSLQNVESWVSRNSSQEKLVKTSVNILQSQLFKSV